MVTQPQPTGHAVADAPEAFADGDTLVVESTNFNGGAPFRGSSEDMTLVERYTRLGPNILEYEFTVDDPTVWTRPWTAMFRWDLDES